MFFSGKLTAPPYRNGKSYSYISQYSYNGSWNMFNYMGLLKLSTGHTHFMYDNSRGAVFVYFDAFGNFTKGYRYDTLMYAAAASKAANTIVGAGSDSSYASVYSLNTSTSRLTKVLSNRNATDLYAVTTDASGNIYAFGTDKNTVYSNPAGFYAVKFNSALARQNEIRFGGTGTAYLADNFNGASCDASGIPYAVGQSSLYTSGLSDIIVAKFTTTLGISWVRRIGTATTGDAAYSCIHDSAGNIYVAGKANKRAALIKYNSAGTLQWQKAFYLNANSSSSGEDVFFRLTLGTDGKIYCGGWSFGSSSNYSYRSIIIARFDANGTYEDHREIIRQSAKTDGAVCYTSPSTDANQILFYLGMGYKPGDVVLSIPYSGFPAVGTYGDYLIAKQTAIVENSSLTNASISVSPTTLSSTFTSSTLTGIPFDTTSRVLTI